MPVIEDDAVGQVAFSAACQRWVTGEELDDCLLGVSGNAETRWQSMHRPMDYLLLGTRLQDHGGLEAQRG